MTTISSKEFISNQDKYFEMAANEPVFIQRADKMFFISAANAENSDKYDEILEPDDDFRRAITGDELVKLINEDLKSFFANK
jgi:hypothetical protein